jgi:hypothetical protein
MNGYYRFFVLLIVPFAFVNLFEFYSTLSEDHIEALYAPPRKTQNKNK